MAASAAIVLATPEYCFTGYGRSAPSGRCDSLYRTNDDCSCGSECESDRVESCAMPESFCVGCGLAASAPASFEL